MLRCGLLGGFSDSQSWAQQSEIKKQNQKQLRRRQSESRILRNELGGSSVEGLQTGGGMISPRPRGPSIPTGIMPNSAESQGAAQCHPLEAEALKPTPPLTPQVHLPGRCAPDNQRHGPFPDHAQTTCCHQVVGPQRLQSFSSAWKVGSSFLCTLCFIFMYFL